MNASKLIADFYDRALAAERQQRAQRAHAVEAFQSGWYFDSYDTLMRADATAAAYAEVKVWIDASADEQNDEVRMESLMDLIHDRVSFAPIGLSTSPADNVLQMARHAAWIDMLRATFYQ